MNKKTLSIALLLAMTTSGALAASISTTVPMTVKAVNANLVSTTVNNQPKLSKYQLEAVKMTQEAMAAKETSDTANYPTAVSLDATKAVALALENNRTAKASSWTYEATKAGVSQAAAGMNPQVAANYSGARSNSGTSVGKGGHTSSSIGFTLSVPVFDASTIASIRGARYTREGAGAAYEEALQTAKYNAVAGYYTLIKDRNAIDVANQSVTDYQGHLTNVEAQYSVGIVANSDVMTSKTTWSDAQTNLVKARNQADLAETDLNQILAFPVSTKIDTADKSLNYAPYNVTLEEAKAYALIHRAKLVESAMNVKKAEEDLHAAKAGYLPTVSASAGRGYSDDGWKGFGDGNDWNIGAKASWSIWNGGGTQAAIKKAQAAFEGAKETNLASIDTVLSQVQKAFLDMKAAEQTITSTKTAVDSAQESFRINTLRYQAGVGANIDVLDAETKLTAARNNYLDAVYNYNIAVAQLEQYTGVPLDTPVGQGASLIATSDAANQLATLANKGTNK